MSPTPVIVVLHNHQPVGNLDWVFDECYQAAYAPFLAVLERHPRIRVGLHYTGPLIEWLEAQHPDYLERVRALVARGQVEVLGGGFYEPILSVLPDRDRAGQLALMRETVARLFGETPRGAWLAERIWEPDLPESLAGAGVDYVLIDDEAFRRQGISDVDAQALYLTEDRGAMMRLLPISYQLRYTLPSAPPEQVVATMREMAAAGAEVLVYAEDGERYGSWPGMYEYVYGEEAYLDRLFTALEEADDVELVLPGEYVARTAPRKLVYLPPSSYTEMMEWSGGFWRNFLSRYRESNLMHKKMYQVSRWVALAENAGVGDITQARRDLYAAQCNCPYWHGSFGGIYLPHLRRAIYEHLLRAERAVITRLPADARPACEIVDHDYDGRDEIWLRDGEVSIGIDPARGGGVFALEHLGAAHNFLDTLGRYPLAAGEGEGADTPPVDWYPRLSFLDHMLAPDATPEILRDARGGEHGDFVLGAYEVVTARPGEVVLRRDGHAWDGPDFAALTVTKRYLLQEDLLTVAYVVTNATSVTRNYRFAVEINASVSAGEGDGRALWVETATSRDATSLAETHAHNAALGVTYADEWLGVTLGLAWNDATACWVLPIYCSMRTLNGFEWVYESTVTLPIWDLELAPGESWQQSFQVVVTAKIPQASLVGAATIS